MRLLFILCALAALAGCPKRTPTPAVEAPVDEPTPTPLPADPLGVRIHTLDNGLTVYLAENHEEPRVYARVVVRAGAAQDPRSSTGMAHYLEHLLANKGTRRLGTTDFKAERPHLDRVRELYDQLFGATDAADREALYTEIGEATRAANEFAIANELKQVWGLMGGRSLNAFTSHDQTSYVVDLPANRLAAWALLDGDRFGGPVFRSFQTEVETVFEEKNRSLDNASRALRDLWSATMYGDHPYGTTVLGEVEHLKNPSVSRTEAYFQQWYVPGNMAVVLSGDFDSDEALTLIKQGMGQIPPSAVPELSATSVDAPAERVLVETTHRGQEAVRIGWLTVPAGHPDEAALDVASLLLSNGSTGLLDVALNQAERVRRADAWAGFRREAGSFVITASSREGQQVDDLEPLLLEQVARLKAGDFDAAQIDALIRNEDVARKRKLHTNRGRADAIARAFVLDEDWDVVRMELARLAAVTAEDVVRVAGQYLGDNPVVAIRRQGEPELPGIAAPDLGELAVRSDAHSGLFDQVMALDVSPSAPQVLSPGADFQKVDTPAGPLFVTKNPYDDLFSMTFRWYRGREQDPTLCHAMSLWGRSGTPDMDRTAFEAVLHALAGDLTVRCGQRTLDITLRGPQASLSPLFALLNQRLSAPVISAEERKPVLDDALLRRAQMRTKRDWSVGAAYSWGLRGEDSSYLGLPDEAAVAGLVDADLGALTNELLRTRRTVVYSGPHGEFELLRLLARPDLDYVDPAEQPAVEYVRPRRARVLVLDHDSAQAAVHLLLPGDPWSEDNHAMRRLLSEYLGGSAGLVFQEIREARGMAYSAHGGARAGARPGDEDLVYASVGTQPDKAAEVAKLLVDLVRGEPADAARWSRSKASAVEKLRSDRIPFQRVGWTAEAWRVRGFVEDPRTERLKALRSPTLSDLATWTKAQRKAPFTLVVVGDLDKMNLKALGRLGRITKLKLDDISR